MDKSEKRFERDIESFLISPEGGYTQFCGQDAKGNWVHTECEQAGLRCAGTASNQHAKDEELCPQDCPAACGG